MTHAPEISICIPVYNCEKYLGPAIESVLDQTFDDFELVIIDDGSTDGTCKVAESFTDPRIRLLKNDKNMGFTFTWNRTITESRGKYYKLLPADDVIYPRCLENQHKAFEADPEIGISFVFGNRDIIDSEGKVLSTWRRWKKSGIVKKGDLAKTNIRHGTNIIGEPGGVLIRTEYIKKTHGFCSDNHFLLDLDMYFQLLAYGDAYVIAESLSGFRIHKGSNSFKIVGRQSRDFSRFIEKTMKDETFDVTRIDALVGKCLSAINAILRSIYYRLYVR